MDYVGGCDDVGGCGVVLVVDAVTFLDFPDWRQGRDEYYEGRLLDRDDIAAWQVETEHERLTPDEMVSWWASERADAMAEYDARDYGWWQNHDDA